MMRNHELSTERTTGAELQLFCGRASASRKGHRGFSLIEVLVAAVIFSLGLGGLSLMLLNSAQGSLSARNQTTAAMHAASLAELILLNPASSGHYINPSTRPGGNCLAPEACSGAAWAAGNLARWQYQLQRSLADATGLVCLDATPEDGDAAEPDCDGNGLAVVKVFWVESRHFGDGDDGRRRAVLPIPE
jgi:type IV pilus assembly protein PilV